MAGKPQTVGDLSQEDLAGTCRELSVLLARATVARDLMVASQTPVIRAKKVAARERGFDAYTSFLDGVEKALLYPEQKPGKKRGK